MKSLTQSPQSVQYRESPTEDAADPSATLEELLRAHWTTKWAAQGQEPPTSVPSFDETRTRLQAWAAKVARIAAALDNPMAPESIAILKTAFDDVEPDLSWDEHPVNHVGYYGEAFAAQSVSR
jgi:hypothetical protein